MTIKQEHEFEGWMIRYFIAKRGWLYVDLAAATKFSSSRISGITAGDNVKRHTLIVVSRELNVPRWRFSKFPKNMNKLIRWVMKQEKKLRAKYYKYRREKGLRNYAIKK